MLSPSSETLQSDLILRDYLAIDRTSLANERTLLAYLRTGITLFLGGATFIHFSNQIWFSVLGAICVPAGLAAFFIGLRRYRFMRKQISHTRSKLSETQA